MSTEPAPTGLGPYAMPDEPASAGSDAAALFTEYLDFYRTVVLRKLAGMSEAELDRARLPSGWTPRGLLKHLTYMEQRWFCWGFAGEAVAEPWGDRDPADHARWLVGSDETTEQLVAAFHRQWARSRAIVAAADLSDRASGAGRFAGSEPPRLVWILFHVLQEYARHAGHLDVVRELADGAIGE